MLTVKIVGLSGTFGSGKDTLAHHLVRRHDFMHVSTGDMVRTVAMERYGDIERPTLVQTANELRHDRGAGVLAQLALEAFGRKQEFYKGLVVSGVRSIGEAETIKQASGAMVFIDTPIEVRYERIKARQRDGEELLSFEEFKASEEKEMTAEVDASDPSVQNLGAMKRLADIALTNSHSLDEFFADAEAALRLS